LELTGETELNSLRYFHFLKTNFRGKALTISRTGFTGDLGYELWVEPKNAEFLWDRLMEIGQSYGLLPVGLAALDMTRVEAGLLLFNVDYTSARSAVIPSQNSTPFELGLGWAVKMEQDNFIGRSALKEKNKAESAREFVGLEIDWVDLEILFGEADLPPQVAGRASRTSLPVYKNDIQIGQATSVLFSPLLKKYIALATLNKSLTKKDLHVEVEITVEYERKRAKAKIVKLPFYNPRRKKSIANG
jgi:aminomethyltransferase